MYKLLVAIALGLLAMLPQALAASAPYRIVTAVDAEAKTFSCRAKPGEPTWTYGTTAKTVYRLGGKMRRASFTDIKVGDSVSVQYHATGHNRVAERVAIRPKQ